MSQQRNIAVTVGVLLLCMTVLVGGFVWRLLGPETMSVEDMRVEGLYLHELPRQLADFQLTDHRGQPFTRERFAGTWSLIFFGFTHCPDICPTTMAFLNELVGALDAAEAADTQVVMVSVDPARDTVEQLASYVPYFNKDFTGVTGEFLDIHRFATQLNTLFRKVPLDNGDYQVDHSSSVVLMNPRGDYHGFFTAPLDQAKMMRTYRAARQAWKR